VFEENFLLPSAKNGYDAHDRQVVTAKSRIVFE
jgi:hypothetical protein